ncbi:GxxExxY protein [Fodinibius halophilus]|uniref:GxxExxY protein n=1 Tax=Fodinibius halophilus TaxID=1736908 RepID=A0A6M1T2W0_9BACT|nr:GxxExxY protein [Fodinibius halophilus]NGP89796.1 GxxExxY protein [Fodinibius halophilus]
MNTYKHHKLTRKIIKGYYGVYNELGTGFLESVYESAMLFTLKNELGMDVKSQVPITVYFRDIIVGEFRADLVVENKVIVELKAVSILLSEHKAQLINYLKATDIELGLLMNFGDEPEFKRFIFDK